MSDLEKPMPTRVLAQVEDDNILEVVDVLLIRVNSWGIHPLHEPAVIWLFEVLQKS
jgi:hypothetical protein